MTYSVYIPSKFRVLLFKFFFDKTKKYHRACFIKCIQNYEKNKIIFKKIKINKNKNFSTSILKLTLVIICHT